MAALRGSKMGELETQAYNAGWDTVSAQMGNPDAVQCRPPNDPLLKRYFTQGYNDATAFYLQHKGGNTYERQ